MCNKKHADQRVMTVCSSRPQTMFQTRVGRKTSSAAARAVRRTARTKARVDNIDSGLELVATQTAAHRSSAVELHLPPERRQTEQLNARRAKSTWHCDDCCCQGEQADACCWFDRGQHVFHYNARRTTKKQDDSARTVLLPLRRRRSSCLNKKSRLQNCKVRGRRLAQRAPARSVRQ